MNILIKFPSRGRPEVFKNTIQIYNSKLSGLHNIKYVCSFDNDDESMNNDDIKTFINSLNYDITYHYGDNKNKIEAINANIPTDNWFDVLILAADDIFPVVHGYDDVVCADLMNTEHKLDSPIHYYTPMWEHKLDVFCIMGRDYYNRFNYIYHPEYQSIFADNEYTETAQLLKRHTYLPKTVFVHHCISNDTTAAKNNTYNHDDQATYHRRKDFNFDVKVD
jgi:hypothetical protein